VSGWTAAPPWPSVGTVIEVREATGPESGRWQEDWRHRLESGFGRHDVSPDWTSRQVERRVADYRDAAHRSEFAVTADGETVGILALVLAPQDGPPQAAIADLWIAPPHRRRGHGSAALRWAENQARHQPQSEGESQARSEAGSQAGSLWVSIDPADPAQAALFRRYPVRSQVMIKRLLGPDPLPDGLEARPMTETRFAAFRAEMIRGYAADIASSGTLPAAGAAVRAATETDELLPDGLNTANHTFLCLYAGPEEVAVNWLCHHREPGASWVYGVGVSERHRGQGYGRAAMTAGEQATLAAGDTHLALNVFGSNAVATGLYQSMGYQTVDQSRSIDL
jgi:ribosomal protein S18 acetylase RimI-like enzyme